jgi:hypothetical protein
VRTPGRGLGRVCGHPGARLEPRAHNPGTDGLDGKRGPPALRRTAPASQGVNDRRGTPFDRGRERDAAAAGLSGSGIRSTPLENLSCCRGRGGHSCGGGGGRGGSAGRPSRPSAELQSAAAGDVRRGAARSCGAGERSISGRSDQRLPQSCSGFGARRQSDRRRHASNVLSITVATITITPSRSAASASFTLLNQVSKVSAIPPAPVIHASMTARNRTPRGSGGAEPAGKGRGGRSLPAGYLAKSPPPSAII